MATQHYTIETDILTLREISWYQNPETITFVLNVGK